MVNFSPDPGPTPDADLLEGVRQGDLEAFEELYERHRDWVYRLAYRFTGNEADALDVLQETFAYLLKKPVHLLPHVRLTSYLYPVTKNIATTLQRKRRESTAAEAVLEHVPAKPEDGGESSRDKLAAVMSGLSDELREAVLMRFVDGLSMDEIAEALRIPAGTVKSRLHNAIKKLRRDPRLRDYFEA